MPCFFRQPRNTITRNFEPFFASFRSIRHINLSIGSFSSIFRSIADRGKRDGSGLTHLSSVL